MTFKRGSEENDRFLNFGIDLGTTNSCIVKQEGTEIRIFQTRENSNTTRSAVHITKNERKIVGLRAYNALYYDPENVAVEFKRLMGTTHIKHFPSSGATMTPEELSAELLMSLRQDAERLTEEIVDSAVITVPSAFGSLQCESTYKAAGLAGIQSVHLLQEPIAAAIAYGIKPDAKDEYWMVFDLGGGTFDVAIVSTYQGRLTILNNEGNNHLGGKDIDNLIAEKMLFPHIEDNFSLFETESDEYQKLLKKLLFKAEDVKIELSNLSRSTVYIDDVGTDASGEEIYFEVEVSREDLELLLEDIIQETIHLSEKALEGANISKEDLSKIILVGGSTQIPAIRNRLKESFKVALDYSLDPITVVARGAAVYASLTLCEKTSDESNPPQTDGLVVDLEYDPYTSSYQSVVAGVFRGNSNIHEASIDSTDGFWESGWFPIQDKNSNNFEVEVTLQPNKTNKFIVKARNRSGDNLSIDGAHFSIKHQEAYFNIAKPLVPHSLLIEYLDNDGNRKLQPIILKNAILPAFGFYEFRASKELRPSTGDDCISIKLWEGEELDEPEANMWVANLYVTSRDISRPLHKGAKIEISLAVDESRRVTIEAAIPMLNNLKIEKDAFYKPTPVDIDERFNQVKEEIDEFYQRLEYINDKVSYSDESRRKEYNDLYNDLEKFSINYFQELELSKQDSDRANIIIAKSKSIRIKIASLERSALIKKQQHQVERDVLGTINRVNYTVDNFSNPDEKGEFEKLKNSLHEAVEFKDSRGVQHIKDKIEDLERKILMKRFDFWQYHFNEICEKEEKFIDQSEAHKWIELGKKADDNKDMSTLSKSVMNLLGLLKKDINQVIKEGSQDPGLMK